MIKFQVIIHSKLRICMNGSKLQCMVITYFYRGGKSLRMIICDRIWKNQPSTYVRICANYT